MGAVLTLTSYPRRTSPVLRGKWVLEEILGTPPPPPPPLIKSLPDIDQPARRPDFSPAARAASQGRELRRLPQAAWIRSALGWKTSTRSAAGARRSTSSRWMPAGEMVDGREVHRTRGAEDAAAARKDEFARNVHRKHVRLRAQPRPGDLRRRRGPPCREHSRRRPTTASAQLITGDRAKAIPSNIVAALTPLAAQP